MQCFHSIVSEICIAKTLHFQLIVAAGEGAKTDLVQMVASTPLALGPSHCRS